MDNNIKEHDNQFPSLQISSKVPSPKQNEKKEGKVERAEELMQLNIRMMAEASKYI